MAPLSRHAEVKDLKRWRHRKSSHAEVKDLKRWRHMSSGHPEVKDLKRRPQVLPTGIGHRDGGSTNDLANNWAGHANLAMPAVPGSNWSGQMVRQRRVDTDD